MSDILKNLALKRNWTYRPGFLFWPGRLTVPSTGASVTVSFNTKSTPPTTAVECALPLKKEGHVYVGPQLYGKIKIDTGPDIQDIKMGNDVFDRSFIVRCEGLDIQKILGGNVQDEMMILFPLLPTLRIYRGQMMLAAKEIIKDETTLGRFVDLGLKILGQVRGIYNN